MDALAVVLFVIGYPVAIVVIFRYVPVVREQRIRWFVAHQAAVAAIVAGQAIRGNERGVLINGAWLVAAAVWYGFGARRARARAV